MIVLVFSLKFSGSSGKVPKIDWSVAIDRLATPGLGENTKAKQNAKIRNREENCKLECRMERLYCFQLGESGHTDKQCMELVTLANQNGRAVTSYKKCVQDCRAFLEKIVIKLQYMLSLVSLPV